MVQCSKPFVPEKSPHGHIQAHGVTHGGCRCTVRAQCAGEPLVHWHKEFRPSSRNPMPKSKNMKHETCNSQFGKNSRLRNDRGQCSVARTPALPRSSSPSDRTVARVRVIQYASPVSSSMRQRVFGGIWKYGLSHIVAMVDTVDGSGSTLPETHLETMHLW